MGKLAEDDAGDYLSGSDRGGIGEDAAFFADGTPHVAGAEALVHRYLAAFDALGLTALAVRRAPRRAGSISLRAQQASSDDPADPDPDAAYRHPQGRDAG